MPFTPRLVADGRYRFARGAALAAGFFAAGFFAAGFFAAGFFAAGFFAAGFFAAGFFVAIDPPCPHRNVEAIRRHEAAPGMAAVQRDAGATRVPRETVGPSSTESQAGGGQPRSSGRSP